MPLKPLPDFKAPTTAEMRALWRAFPEESVRRLILEIEHQRRVLMNIEGYRESIDRSWKSETHSQLVGLHQLRLLMAQEISRAGLNGADTVPAPGDAAKRYP